MTIKHAIILSVAFGYINILASNENSIHYIPFYFDEMCAVRRSDSYYSSYTILN